MSFRDREKERLVPLKTELFSGEACDPGIYHHKRRPFYLWNDNSDENLHAGLRARAVEYFRGRAIPWHDGEFGHSRPSGHLCSSQVFCVNALFPFVDRPDLLGAALRAAGLPVAEVLPFTEGGEGGDPAGAVVFEWTGRRNYLGEHIFGEPAADEHLHPGAGFTSADFAIRVRRDDGRVEILLGEWKYTEEYPSRHPLRYAHSGTDRLAIYGPAIAAPHSQLRLGDVAPEALLYDPFDQLLRLQLLAGEMEHAREGGAEVVAVALVAPRANRDLVERITAPALAGRGATIGDIWRGLVEPQRFHAIYVEDLLGQLLAHAPDPAWAAWMRTRYGEMK